VQLAGLKQVNEPTRLSYALGSGETSLPGFPVYIADNGGGAGSAVQKATMTALGVFGSAVPAFPPTGAMSSAWSQADGFIRYVVVGNPGFNALNMDIGTASGLASRFGAVSALDGNISDISPFMNKGAKLLIWTGTADMLITPRATEFFYSRMQSSMGAAKVDSFVRFYQIPGGQHGPSSVFQPEWDQLAAIENWVEKGADPANNLIVTDDAGVPGRTRPMCVYPTWPKYKGSGDINSAASYACAST
jgi:feruloyl esterase